MMAYSRVYLGAHFITDVIPGMMAGSFIGWLLYLLYKFLRNRQGRTGKKQTVMRRICGRKDMFRLLLLIIALAGCCREGMCRNDTLPAMTSGRLLRGVAFPSQDLRCGSPYMEMTGTGLQRKTGFTRRGSQFILPAAFVVYGTAARFNRLPVRRVDYFIEKELRKRVSRKYTVDDYFEYGMPALAGGLGFIPGVDSRHGSRDRMLILATSLIVMEGSVVALKMATAVSRPGNGAPNSFPSGHTAVTMMSAHILYKEYKDTSPWIGVGGYLVATATGILRMVNQAHWASDVVMGAGIGLLGAEVGYMMLPVWHSVFGMKGAGRQLSAVPAVTARSIGLGIVCRY
jgi:membrane-associated phospholipid phosphatase